MNKLPIYPFTHLPIKPLISIEYPVIYLPIRHLSSVFCLLSSVICHLSSVFCPRPSTLVERPLQIAPFMQNKANFRKSQMNVTAVLTKDYENKSNWTLGENKPNQTQFPKSPNECKLIYNKGLQKKRWFRSPKKQTQFKPNLETTPGPQWSQSSST